MNFAHANKSSHTIAIQKSLFEPRNTEIIGPLLRCALLHHALHCVRHPLHCLHHLTSLKESTCTKENLMSNFKLVYMPKLKEINKSNWSCFLYMQMSKICYHDHFLLV
ncbi:hypothetical protein ACJW31_04G036400 [Castanea mollissima]